jgi:very-short-patch-repair endonuclease
MTNLRPRTIDVLVDRQRRSRPGVTVHRTTYLDPREVTVRDRLPLTTPARTLLDLADVLDRRPLERALDTALGAKLTTLAELHATLGRHPGRRGAPLLRALLDPERPSTRTRLEKEEAFLALVRAAGLPAPRVNAPFDRYEIDFFWPAERFAVEIDSHRWHGGREAYGRDRRKGLVLAKAGIDLLRLAWEQVEDDVPAVVGTVAFRLGRAAA